LTESISDSGKKIGVREYGTRRWAPDRKIQGGDSVELEEGLSHSEKVRKGQAHDRTKGKKSNEGDGPRGGMGKTGEHEDIQGIQKHLERKNPIRPAPG